MFKKQNVISLLFILFLATSTFFFFFSLSDDKIIHYQKLMLLSEGKKEKNNETAQQHRVGISKQFLYTQNNQRLQTRLQSKESFLFFRQTSSEYDLIEEFNGLAGKIQEKKNIGDNQDNQLIQYLEAEKGVYSYHTGILKATDVVLLRHLVKDKNWPLIIENDSLLLFQGKAQRVDLSLLNGPSLKFYDLRASLFEWGDRAKK